jgi:Tfp pilus assembly protein PilN
VQSNVLEQEKNVLLESSVGESELSPREILSQANDRRTILASYAEQQSLAPILADIVGLLRGGVYIDSIQFASQANGGSTISLRGRADERDALVAFSRSLEALSSVSTVDLPVSSLASNTDLAYSMTITLHSL